MNPHVDLERRDRQAVEGLLVRRVQLEDRIITAHLNRHREPTP